MATYDEIATALGVHALALCRVLVPHGRAERGAWRIGSTQDEAGRSLSVRLGGPRAGQWIDHATGERGDAIGLISQILACKRGAAFRWAADWLGDAPPTPERLPDADAWDDRDMVPRWVERCWRHTAPGGGSPVETYLRGRGITTGVPGALRYTAECRHPAGERLPAMVAEVVNAAGMRVAVHRTYLDLDGRKAVVNPVRASLGPVAGGVVRLTVRLAVVGEEIGLAEGIETALSATMLSGLPVWSTLSAGGLRAVALPPGIRHVTIFADRDRAGAIAARDAHKRLTGEGRDVNILFPADGNDFNDVVQGAMKR